MTKFLEFLIRFKKLTIFLVILIMIFPSTLYCMNVTLTDLNNIEILFEFLKPIKPQKKELELLFNAVINMTLEDKIDLYNFLMQDGETPDKKIWKLRYRDIRYKEPEVFNEELEKLLRTILEKRQESQLSKATFYGFTATFIATWVVLVIIGALVRESIGEKKE